MSTDKTKDDDKFVDELIKSLPKAPPRTKIEQRRMEKFIDDQIAQLKAERAKSKSSLYVRFQTQFQLAAGFLVLVGGIAFALNNSSSNPPTTISQPTPVTSPSQLGPIPSPSAAPTKNPRQSGNNGGSSGQVFGNETKSPSAVSNIFNTGIDYLTAPEQAKAKITPKLAPISLGAMSTADRNCSIKLGINEVLAIDHAKYDGMKAHFYYYKNSDGMLEISLTDSNCNFIKRLE